MNTDQMITHLWGPGGKTPCGRDVATGYFINDHAFTSDRDGVDCPDCLTALGVTSHRFALTFGVKYSHEPHPVAPKLVHPDGYVTIIAPDEEQARRIACSNFGIAWAFLYPEDRLGHEHYPLGELAVLTGPSHCRNCGDVLTFILDGESIDGIWLHHTTGASDCADGGMTEPDSANLARPGYTEQDTP